VLLGLYCMQVK